MNTIAITWQDVPDPEWGRAVLSFLDAVLAQLEHTHWDLCVVFFRDSFIYELNKTTRRIHAPSHVLSLA